jgi:hypothetical protein
VFLKRRVKKLALFFFVLNFFGGFPEISGSSGVFRGQIPNKIYELYFLIYIFTLPFKKCKIEIEYRITPIKIPASPVWFWASFWQVVTFILFIGIKGKFIIFEVICNLLNSNRY